MCSVSTIDSIIGYLIKRMGFLKTRIITKYVRNHYHINRSSLKHKCSPLNNWVSFKKGHQKCKKVIIKMNKLLRLMNLKII